MAASEAVGGQVEGPDSGEVTTPPNLWKDMRPPLVTSLVTTVGEDGSVNASPKSWWTPISYQPPALVLSVRPDSDTARNIRETGVFVLHLPPQEIAKEVLHTAKRLPYGENELIDQKLDFSMIEHDRLPRPIPVITDIPWMLCFALSVVNAGDWSDHDVYTAQVVMAGGFNPEEGVEDVLIHRTRNEFMRLCESVMVEPY